MTPDLRDDAAQDVAPGGCDYHPPDDETTEDLATGSPIEWQVAARLAVLEYDAEHGEITPEQEQEHRRLWCATYPDLCARIYPDGPHASPRHDPPDSTAELPW